MQEPDWAVHDQVPFVNPGSLIWVVKKSRGKFGQMIKAVPGEYGLVISVWHSSMGTEKLTFITENCEERAITANSVRVWGDKKDKMHFEKWNELHRRWMDQTYVPVIVLRKMKDRRYQKPDENPYVMSRAGDSTLVNPISNPKMQMWLPQSKIHPDDWEQIVAAKQQCLSVRMPTWMAKKAGVFGL